MGKCLNISKNVRIQAGLWKNFEAVVEIGNRKKIFQSESELNSGKMPTFSESDCGKASNL